MKDTHAEFGESAEKGQFLVRDLAGAKPGDGIRSVAPLEIFEALAKQNHGAFPIARQQWIAAAFTHEWRQSAVR